MRYGFIQGLFLFSFIFNNISASVNSTLNYLEPGVKIGELSNQKQIFRDDPRRWTNDECDLSRNKGYPLLSPESGKEQFELSTHLGYNDTDTKSNTTITVLNVTISNVTFRKLKVYRQTLVAPSYTEKIYKTIELDDYDKPQDISLFFAVEAYYRMRIQFFADDSHNGFFKEFHYSCPAPSDISNKFTIGVDKIFSYVDTTFQEKVWLYIQPLPENFNITTYMVEFGTYLQESTYYTNPFNLTHQHLHHKYSNFTDRNNYDFQLTPINNNGTPYKKTRVANFCLDNRPSIIIMMVSIPVALILVFFALYIVYLKYRGQFAKWLETRQPQLLIVYSATYDSHRDVVEKLVGYLKECRINAMDLLYISAEAHQNPGHWCDKAFKVANIVIVLASPPSENASPAVGTPYRLLDERATTLIHENRRCKNKRYYAVLLPYSKGPDLSQEASILPRIEIKKAKDLKKLVNIIHDAKYCEEFKTPDTKELWNSIELATRNILHKEAYSIPNNSEKSTDPISITLDEGSNNINPQDKINDDTILLLLDDETTKHSYEIPISMLNLSGDKKDPKTDSAIYTE